MLPIVSWPKFCPFGKGLTLYHTIPTFNNTIEESFGKHCGKRRKCWKPAFTPFSHSVF